MPVPNACLSILLKIKYDLAVIYLDYAATTPLDPRVEEAMRPFSRTVFGNASSLHAVGRRAWTALDDARDQIAELLGAQSAEIIFTGSGTESDNLALIGSARALRARGNHIITTAFEHHAVLESCRALQQEGFTVSYLTPNREGYISCPQVAEAITAQTTLVSVMYANNEVGTVQPIAEIGCLCRERGIVFHTDAVQATGELPVDVQTLGVNLLSLSAHKVYGPKGVGALFVRTGTRVKSLIHGGGQEFERRAGTENVAGIVGFATALSLVQQTKMSKTTLMRDRLLEGLLQIPGSRLHGGITPRLANNVNVGFSGVIGETLLVALDLEGIAVSTGSACSAGAVSSSHVLRSMGYSVAEAQQAIRFSLGQQTTSVEIEETIATVTRLVARLRR